MMSFFDDDVKSVDELEYESNSQRKMTVAGFHKDGKSIVLVWYSDKVPGDDLAWDRVDLTLKKVKFQYPVYVEMITGKVFELDKSSWKTDDGNTRLTQLPVWDSPTMIAERSLVELRKEL